MDILFYLQAGEPLKEFQLGSDGNRQALSRAFLFAGWEEEKRGGAREGSGQLVYKPGGHTWKGAEESTERIEPRTSPEDIRVRG